MIKGTNLTLTSSTVSNNAQFGGVYLAARHDRLDFPIDD